MLQNSHDAMYHLLAVFVAKSWPINLGDIKDKVNHIVALILQSYGEMWFMDGLIDRQTDG